LLYFESNEADALLQHEVAMYVWTYMQVEDQRMMIRWQNTRETRFENGRQQSNLSRKGISFL
jgi:hypothetical protein